ncbi:CYTH domain-containing protein [Vagococcus jeotgali]|uniref:CYTH domain-containing protein n=1 Tax=Vagococcus jeotgali TaxID=3109030 RepID=UPI002DDB1175|nr:CYTH domain-containing protein [Vagococcus sp. B2T-5]
MSQEVEIEFKNMLTEKEYQQLNNSLFASSKSFTQTNYYFDTPSEALKQAGMGLRLRKLKDKNECTLKVPTDNPHSYLELTDNLTDEQMKDSLENLSIPSASEAAKYLRSKDIDPTALDFIGDITTIRKEVNLQDTQLLVLDESQFQDGIVDYELEMEVSDISNSEELFNSLLREHGITHRPSKKKVARMIAYKQDISQG